MVAARDQSMAERRSKKMEGRGKVKGLAVVLSFKKKALMED